MTNNGLETFIRKSYGFQAAGPALAAVLAGIKKAVQNGETVKLAGFGTFHLKVRKARIYRNPRNGEAVAVPERHGVRFKPSAKFLDSMDVPYVQELVG